MLAGLVRQVPLPRGVDSIVIPRITIGAATGIQTADNATVQETEVVETSVTLPVRTVAGQSDVAMQLLDQSAPLTFDQVVFLELMADYNRSLGAQLIAGTATSGQVAGLIGAAGQTVSYTDATPTAQELQVRVAEAASQAATNRKMVPTAVLMHGRRWFWITAAMDSQNRPIVPPSQDPPDPDRAEGLMGAMCGLALYADPGIPTTVGGGTEDRIIVTRPQDHLLLESPASRLRISFAGAESGTLTARLQVVRYVAWTGALYPSATSVVDGTALAAPVFP